MRPKLFDAPVRVRFHRMNCSQLLPGLFSEFALLKPLGYSDFEQKILILYIKDGLGSFGTTFENVIHKCPFVGIQ